MPQGLVVLQAKASKILKLFSTGAFTRIDHISSDYAFLYGVDSRSCDGSESEKQGPPFLTPTNSHQPL
jgi:hypothetical protein